jgi:hypothetical protein
MNGFEDLVYVAGCTALAVLAILVGLNLVVIVARLSRHGRFAQRMVTLLAPFTTPFRIGSIKTTTRSTAEVAHMHD